MPRRPGCFIRCILNIRCYIDQIKGNRYRLVVAIDYQYGIIYIRFVGPHQAYDQIDAATI